jgi:chromate transporter
MPDDGPPESSPPARARLAEVAGVFLKLGFTAFGGPAAHVALIEEEVVTRRGWVDRQHFLDMISAVNFVPGPNSTELAIHLGQVRAGFPGLVVAGACFITPAMLIILPIAWAYVAFGKLPAIGDALVGVKACMVAIVVVALVRFARTGIRDRFTATVTVLAIGASGVMQYYRVPQQELIVLAAAAVAGLVWYGKGRAAPVPVEETRSATRLNWSKSSGAAKRSAQAAPLLIAPAALGATGFWAQLLAMALFFLKVGATLFGSGYVLASFLHGGLVEQHKWLTEQELLDAIAVGQVTPGPLLTAATFIGYLLCARNFGGGAAGGVLGGVVATLAIFLPSFMFITFLGPLLPRLRASPRARGALDGMNAAVVALILLVSLWFARSVLWPPAGIDLTASAVFVTALTILLTVKINPTWLILASAAVGLLVHRLH